MFFPPRPLSIFRAGLAWSAVMLLAVWPADVVTSRSLAAGASPAGGAAAAEASHEALLFYAARHLAAPEDQDIAIRYAQELADATADLVSQGRREVARKLERDLARLAERHADSPLILEAQAVALYNCLHAAVNAGDMQDRDALLARLEGLRGDAANLELPRLKAMALLLRCQAGCAAGDPAEAEAVRAAVTRVRALREAHPQDAELAEILAKALWTVQGMQAMQELPDEDIVAELETLVARFPERGAILEALDEVRAFRHETACPVASELPEFTDQAESIPGDTTATGDVSPQSPKVRDASEAPQAPQAPLAPLAPQARETRDAHQIGEPGGIGRGPSASRQASDAIMLTARGETLQFLPHVSGR